MRVFLYDDDTGNARASFAAPQVYVIDGTEPTLEYLGLSTMEFGVASNNPFSDVNLSTAAQ